MTHKKMEVLKADLEGTYVAATLCKLQQSQPEESKVLGVRYNPHKDCITFDIANIADLAASLEPTKRNIVSTVGKFYDPLQDYIPETLRTQGGLG